MKALLFFALMCGAVAIPQSGFADSHSDPAADGPKLSLGAMVRSVKVALLKAQNKLNTDGKLPLCQVTLDMNVATTKVKGGGVNFFFIRADAKTQQQASSQLTMVLTPPKAGAGQDVSPAESTLVDALTSAMFEGAAAYSIARTGEPELAVSSYVIEVEFGVGLNGEGKIDLVFPNGGVNAGGSFSKDTLQKIVMEFGEDACGG